MQDEPSAFLLRRSVALLEEDPKEARKAFRSAAQKDAKVCPSCKEPVKHRAGLEWCQDRQISETNLQDRIRDRAQRRGWTVAHVGKGIAGFTPDGTPIFVTSMIAGWPDLFLMNAKMPPGRQAIAMELKKEAGEVSEDQWTILRLLNACGIPAIVVRPSDLRLGRVNAILEGR